KLNRMEVLEAGAVRQTVGAQERIPLLDRLWQAQARMERAYTRAQRELERLQKARRAESPVTVATAIPSGLSSPSPEIGNPEPHVPPIAPDLIYHAANS